MATYSEKDFDTSHYDSARPSYPDAFYQTLIEYHKQRGSTYTDLAVDIGCGSGFVAFKLLNYFRKVIGTDISQAMIDSCCKSPQFAQCQPRIQFLQGAAEKAPSDIEAGSVDLITGAECCHWVDHAAFFKESHRLLKPGGTLAYWFYLDPVFIGHDVANDLFVKYAYGSSLESPQSEDDKSFEKYMGPYYEQPGHEFLRTAMKTVEVPSELYEDVVQHHYDPKVHGVDPGFTTLYIEREITLNTWRQYVRSWSGYHAWMKENGSSHKDVADAYVDELKEKLGWDDDSKFLIVFPTIYTFARKRATS